MSNTAFRVENGLFVEGNANVAGNLNISGDFNVGGTLTAAVNATGDLIPSTPASQSLGNTTYRWSLNATTINANGAVSVNGFTSVGTSAFTGNVTVDSNVLFVDTVNNRVGVNRTPAQALDVSGTVNATALIGALAWSNVTSKPSPNVTVTLTGDVTGSGNVTLTELANGTISITTTIAGNSVALGTDTTGNYVASVINADASMVVSGTGEGAAVTIAHADTSALANVSYTGGTVVTGMNVDTYGHLQTVESANLDTRYARTGVEAVFDSDVIATTSLVARGAGVGSQGGELVLGYGNNLATTANADSNYVWKFDVAANNNIRLFARGANATAFTVLRIHDLTGESTFANDIYVGTSKVFHEGNDGATSGLDAQFLQGLIPGTGTTNLPVSNGVLMGNLNSLRLNSQLGSFYTNATNINTGLLPNTQLGSGTANTLTFLRGDRTWAEPLDTNLGQSGNTTTLTVTSSTGTDVTIATANSTRAGVLTSADRTKLDGIAAGAQVGTVTSVATGNGIIGGTITGSGTLYLDDGAGLVLNATGIHVGSGDGIGTTSVTVFVVDGDGIIANSTGVHVRTGSGVFANASGLYVNASSIAIGTLTSGRLSGTYNGTLSFSNVNNTLFGNGYGITSVRYQNVIDSPYKDAATVATTAALTATYVNGSSGVGATLTNSGTQATLSIDGVSLVAGNRVLVKNQATAAQNGLYVVTNNGSASVDWVLTRVVDADTTSELAGALVTVDQGTTNGSKLFSNDWKSTSVVGTTSMAWYEVPTSASGTVPAWTTSRTITLGGDLTGSASFNGSANFTLTANIVPADLLTRLLTVDGSGSGLDADLLDGLSSAAFIRADAADNVSGNTEWQDDAFVAFGTGGDTKIYHDGTNSYIDQITGDLIMRYGTAGSLAESARCVAANGNFRVTGQVIGNYTATGNKGFGKITTTTSTTAPTGGSAGDFHFIY